MNLNFELSDGWREEWLKIEEHPKGAKPEEAADIAKMAKAVEKFVRSHLRRIPETPKLLVICGRSGVGKTVVAVNGLRAFRELGFHLFTQGHVKRPPTIHSTSWSDLANIEPHERKRSLHWEDAVDADMTLLDDVGSESDRFRSGISTDNLRLMLSLREKKRTIITTNLPPSDWANQWDDRVDDRFERNSTVVALKSARSYWKTRKTHR